MTKLKLILITVFSAGLLLSSCDNNEPVDLCLDGSLQNGVIAFYDFNAGSLSDASGNADDLINNTSASSGTDRFGNANCAYTFFNDGTTIESLRQTNTDFMNGHTSFSISLWYQPAASTREGGDYEVLIGRGTGRHCPDRRGEWSIGLYDCRRAVFGHNNSVWSNLDADPFDSCEGEMDLQVDVWHHLVAVKDNDSFRIFINSELQEEETGNANCSGLYIAQDIGDLIFGDAYTGKLDDIIIYDRPLTATEVIAAFKAESCCK